MGHKYVPWLIKVTPQEKKRINNETLQYDSNNYLIRIMLVKNVEVDILALARSFCRFFF